MRTHLPLVVRLLLAPALLVACQGDDDTALDTAPPDRGAIVGIGVVPFSPTVAVGEAVQLQARAFYEDESSALVEGIVWQSADTRLLTVDAFGLATGLAAGEGSVVASLGELSATTRVVIRNAEDRPASAAAQPSALSVQVGDVAAIHIVATYDDGSTGQIEASCSWSTSDAAIATVDQGQVEAIRPGSSTVQARCGSLPAMDIPVTVAEAGGTVQPADLQITYFAAEQRGADLRYELVVTNSGQGNAGGFWLDLFADLPAAPTTSDSLDDLAWIPGLAAGASQPVRLTLVGAGSGTYRSWAAVDLDDRIDEANEANNISGPVTTEVSGAQPDLVITWFDALTDGESTLYEVDITNQGAAASGGFWVDLFVDTDADPVVNDLGDDFQYVDALDADGTVTLEFLIEDAPTSSWSSVVFADTNNEVSEANESNNQDRTSVSGF